MHIVWITEPCVLQHASRNIVQIKYFIIKKSNFIIHLFKFFNILFKSSNTFLFFYKNITCLRQPIGVLKIEKSFY